MRYQIPVGSKTVTSGSPSVTVCEPAPGGPSRRSISGSPMSRGTATTAPPWRPTANRPSKSPSAPKGAFVNGNFGALTRRAPPGQVVSAVPPGRGDPKPPLEPKTPRVVELLRKANEWNALLESGTIASQAAIARREGVTRARVTQIMGLLRLAPEIQEKILSSPGTLHCRYVTERMLRPIGAIADQRDQLREFQKNIM